MEEIRNEETITYEKALAELTALVQKVEKQEVSFADLESDIKRAMELIKFCKRELAGYKARFAALQQEQEDSAKLQ